MHRVRKRHVGSSLATTAVLLAVALACRSSGGVPAPLGGCGSPLPPLTDGGLRPERFDEADTGLLRFAELAEDGDVEGASGFFQLMAHDLTHDVDGPLRAEDEGLAIRLCNEVLQLEEGLVADTDGDRLAKLARSSRALLAEARTALAVE
jgi:hypothetical protein